ncbi:hypothetical protein O181_050401 [Austropuccinia psidii MF-1]|uniref:Uncharacterized protein n=1 Tax=Austropuccinia psidii MF-1 TaxID=1389203 RepID=A0A9Q3HMB9_9BASI|nr:hypothetical protein [Austropuccinia psidii MF-1]
MKVVHKAGNINKNADGLSRWALPNPPEIPAYVLAKSEPQIPNEGINVTDVGKELFEEVRESCQKDWNCQVLLLYFTNISKRKTWRIPWMIYGKNNTIMEYSINFTVSHVIVLNTNL